MNKKMTVQKFVEGIVDAVQAEAAKIPDFINGAIRILLVSKSDEADDFFVGFGHGCEMDLVYKIREGGSRIRPAGFRGDSTKPERDCYGTSANKVGGCAYALKNGLGRRSGDAPKSAEITGRLCELGCVAYDIYMSKKPGLREKSEHYFRLYVSVDGCSPEEDDVCAFASRLFLYKWMDGELDDDGQGRVKSYLSMQRPDQHY